MRLEGGVPVVVILEVVLVGYDSALDDYFAHLLYLDYAVSVRCPLRSGARWRQIDGGDLVTLVNPSVGCGHFGRECENMLLEGALWKNCENAFTVLDLKSHVAFQAR